MKKVIHVLFFVTQLNQQYWHLNLKAGKQRTKFVRCFLTVDSLNHDPNIWGFARSGWRNYQEQMRLLQIPNHQPLLNMSKQTHSLLTAAKKYDNKKKLRDSGLKLWLFWILPYLVQNPWPWSTRRPQMIFAWLVFLSQGKWANTCTCFWAWWTLN